MDTAGTGLVGRTYTRGRRQPYLIRKWPGSNWALPLGPYTITQLVVFVASVYLLFSYRHLWGHFGGFNLVLGVGVPIALMYATRHTRIEGRDPLRTGVALASLLMQPRHGYLGGDAVRPVRVHTLPPARFPVAALPAALLPPPAPPPVDTGSTQRWVSDLVGEAQRRAGAP